MKLRNATRAVSLFVTLAGAATLFGAPADDGQGTAAPGSRTDGLRPGQHLLGPRFDAGAALGKIVVLEIGGS